MVEIHCNVNEKHHFLKVLKYCEKKRKEEFKKGKINQKELEIDLEVIERLKNRVNGIYYEDYQNVSAKEYRSKLNGKKENLPSLDLPYLN